MNEQGLLHIISRDKGIAKNGECSHLKNQIVVRTFRNGSKHLVPQCQNCGHAVGGWLKQTLLTPADVPEWSAELQRLWADRRQLRLPL